MRKRILIDLLNLATPEIAGVGIFARNLFELWLAELPPFEIVFVSSNAVNAEETFRITPSDTIRVKSIAIRNVLLRFLYQQTILPFKLRQFDLYYNPALGIPYLSRLVAPKAKLMVTIHDMIPFFYPKKYSALRSVLVRNMSIFAARAAHKVITVSNNSKNDIVSIAHVDENKVVVVYNFIPPPYQLTNDEDDKYFLCISTLEPGKNVEQVIRGFGRFKKRTGYSYRFYWVGRIGWVYTQNYLDKIVENENLKESFIFKGYLSEVEKQDILRRCTSIVYLSHYEGFGLPVLEGLTFNKPSLVSNNSSLPEVAGETGVLCDPLDTDSIAEGLNYVIANRHDLSSAIPSQLEKFSPTKQIAAFKKAIEELLNQGQMQQS